MEKKKENHPQQVNIKLTAAEAEGIYSNFAIISHSTAEFIIDFTRLLPGNIEAKVHARIVMTPQHAKLLLNALNDNIHKFEKMHGEIKADGGPQSHSPFPGFPGAGLPN